MHYKKPQYYDNFTCIADRCPDTCCAGWQIVIDDTSLENYGKISGTFGMHYKKPQYYDNFTCIADRCPDTCCAGWQIVIDDTSLENYGKISGTFGERLQKSIDWEEGIFRQNQRRCAFLNQENLCDLYRELGADSLCDTCSGKIKDAVHS